MIAQILVAALSLQLTGADRQFEVTTFNGESLGGRIVEWSADQLVVRNEAATRSFSADELLTVLGPARSQRLPSIATRLQAMLIDGSVIHGLDVTTSGENVAITTSGGQRLNFAAKQLWNLRFSPGGNSRNADWSELVKSELSGDAIVIKRGASATDYLEGVVNTVRERDVGFKFENEDIDVSRDKLEGIIFFQKQPIDPDDAAPPFIVRTLGGVWRGRQLTLQQDQLVVESLAGVRLVTPLSQIQRIDFSSGRVVYLGDIDPALVDIQPFLPSTALPDQLVNLLYAPRRNQSFQGKSICLRGEVDTLEQTYQKGLAIHSRTEIVYRLSKQFQRFKTIAGIDPSAKAATQVRLVVSADGNPLFDQMVSGDAAPVELDLDMTDVKRLAILVDYGDNWDADDRLHLANARLIK